MSRGVHCKLGKLMSAWPSLSKCLSGLPDAMPALLVAHLMSLLHRVA